MRARPKAAGDGPDLRRLLAERYREKAVTFPTHVEDDGTCFREPWTDKANRLDAGEPLVIYGWEVTGWLHGALRGVASERFRLDPDGSLVRVRAVHVGDTVLFEDA